MLFDSIQLLNYAHNIINMDTIKIAVTVFLLFYFGIILGYRSYLLYRQTGINTVKEKEKRNLEGFIEKVFIFCLLLLFVIGINFVFLENNYQYLIPIHYLETDLWRQIGMGLSFSGLTFTFISQLQMGTSWRLGHNKKEKTALIKTRLFRYSRNPIYLGLLIAFIGFFLMVPNAVSLCFLMMSYVSLEIKIRLEESYLIGEHGEDYRDYLNKVRRWL